MQEDCLANGVFITIVLVIISGLLVVGGVVLGYQYAKRRYSHEIEQYQSKVESLESERAELHVNYTQLKQDHAGVKYELGSLQRDKAYLEARLNG